MSTLAPEMEREIEATIDDQIANGELGPEPPIPGLKSRKHEGPSVKQMDEIVLPTPETVVVVGRDRFPHVEPIEVDGEFAEYDRFMKRAQLLDIEVF